MSPVGLFLLLWLKLNRVWRNLWHYHDNHTPPPSLLPIGTTRELENEHNAPWQVGQGNVIQPCDCRCFLQIPTWLKKKERDCCHAYPDPNRVLYLSDKKILHSLRNYWERNWLRASYNVLIFCYIPILVLAENNLYCHIKTILYSLRIYWQSNTLLVA